MPRFIVAIDGGAGSGKSTTAKGIAQRLNFFYLDTGAMYRAATLKYIQLGGSAEPIEMSLIKKVITGTTIDLRLQEKALHVYLDGRDVTLEIRTTPVNDLVSPVSAIPSVREWMVEQQQAVAEGKNCVCEGRDIGTVVFPDAQVKIFMKADLRERAQRRTRELIGQNMQASVDDVVKNLKYRDEYDSNRSHSPLRKAEDAIVVDTTDLTIEEEITLVENIVRERIALSLH